MELSHLITPKAIMAQVRASSKKKVLQQLSAHAAELTGVKETVILNALLEREKLGSTGVGHGVAIPHARLDAIDCVYGVFARLAESVDFDSVDDHPVDLVFLLLAPKDASVDHLKALHRVSRLLREKQLRTKLRGANDAGALYALLTNAGEQQVFSIEPPHSKAS